MSVRTSQTEPERMLLLNLRPVGLEELDSPMKALIIHYYNFNMEGCYLGSSEAGSDSVPVERLNVVVTTSVLKRFLMWSAGSNGSQI